jgi:hypothetical protein
LKLLLLIFCITFPCVCLALDKWEEAEKQIIRSDPESFDALPKTVAEHFKQIGCKIPKSLYSSNVVVGHFAKTGQKDFVILCSIGGNSSIKILWGGEDKCADEIPKTSAPDRNYLQDLGSGILYSRGLKVISVGGFNSHLDGVEESFEEKTATVWKCQSGKWSKRRISGD